MNLSIKKNPLLLIPVAALAGVLLMPQPTWYEVKYTQVYACAAIDNDKGICVHTEDESKTYETVSKVDWIGGHYIEFRGPNAGETCATMRKGKYYDSETLCGTSTIDTIDIIGSIK